MNQTDKYYGKYRGTVLNNIDLEQRGRIIATIPDVLGTTPSNWALPCVPIAGKQEGTFMVPQIGAAVWIEFEQGDPDYPIWVGGFWGTAKELPAMALAPPPIPGGQNIVFQTTGQSAIILSDTAPSQLTGGIILKSASGSAKIIVNDAGIFIDNGKKATLTMIGNIVTINDGALVII
jgi:uncharacterized protein involved in type VI secretion and phage assembly